jgi:ATP-dependent helicase/nuclease subunit A
MSQAHTAAYEINARAVSAAEFYAVACDPRRSVAVEACAGAGKTWMLVSRILRALLEGAQPHNILAITFTKKAAGEMRERLMHWLAEFAQATPAQRTLELTLRGLSPLEAQRLEPTLQTLHLSLLAAGRPVQIRTFHSWFAALLRGAPLATLQDLGLPLHYELLEDDARAVAQVWPVFYKQLAQDTAAHQDFANLVAVHGRSNVQKALEGALNKRVEFTLADRQGVVAKSVPDAATWMAQHAPGAMRTQAYLGLACPLARLSQPAVRAQWLAWAQSLGQEKNKTPQTAAAAVVDAYLALDAQAQQSEGQAQASEDQAQASEDQAQALGDQARVLEAALAMLRKAFFVKDEDRLSKNLQSYAAAQEAQTLLQSLCAAQSQHEAWLYQQAMVRLTRLLISCFAGLKRERGWVDMNDIELAALHVLCDADVGAWVQERLDASISHLLIDEFQDTSPLQWQALSAWLGSYAGAARAPSVFIVGDPKQSIYRFRRAEPQVFLDAQAVIRELGGDLLSCDHTRRNAQAVIQTLNDTFVAAQEAQAFAGFRPHTTASAQAGQVGRLPPIPRLERSKDLASSWRDSLTTPREQAEDTLRTLECRQAAQWVAQQIAQGHQAADIMVLARKRDRLSAMQLALRELGIAANLAEKKDLAQAPEVQDLVALMDVLVSNHHNLSLARVLKSPLCALALHQGDEALVLLARCSAHHEPALSWWQVLSNLEQEVSDAQGPQTLLMHQSLIEGLREVFVQLQRWRDWLHSLPPHDALSRIFHDGDVVARFVAASPPTLRDAVQANLQAVLSAALQVDGARFLTAYALVRALKAGGIQAPQRSLAQAVQLLTVHGAKGLEAPCVLLLDTDAKAPNPPTMGVLIDWPGRAAAPEQFIFLPSEKAACPSSQALVAREQTAREREELNSLYVAVTRAKTCLMLSSVVPHQAAPGSWWQRVPATDLVLDAAPQEGMPPSLPTMAQAEPPTASPIPPSVVDLPVLTRLPAAGPVAAAVDEQAALASRIGEAMHRLLEWASLGARDVSAAQCAQVAQAFMLTAAQAQEAADRARTILTGQGAWAWDAQRITWHANEVPVVVDGQLHRIDRLVCVAGPAGPEWWVIDYKSAADPLSHQDLGQQLRRYRDAVAALHAGELVRAAFFNAVGQVQELTVCVW